MGLNMLHGGHMTHGYISGGKKMSVSSVFFDARTYSLNEETLDIDFEGLEKSALEFKPHIIICGFSSYTKNYDYKPFRDICTKININEDPSLPPRHPILMADIAHTSGMIASKLLNNPFEYCDIVTSTTHKSLRGPRSGLIFFRRGAEYDYEEKINFAVFP